MANQSTMTPEIVERILANIRRYGCFREVAAGMAGVRKDQLARWLKNGRAELDKAAVKAEQTRRLPKLGRFAQFVVALEQVEDEVEGKAVGVLAEIASARGPDLIDETTGQPIPGSGPLLYPDAAFRSATWWLSRKNNLRYGSGSQRTDLVRGGKAEGDDTEADAGAYVLDKLAQFVALKVTANERADSSGE